MEKKSKVNSKTILRRDVHALADKTYDLVIIGGGVFGAFATLQASLQGLKVVLLEKIDFCHGTSGHHFKMAHGGIRYLQHVDIVRTRESSHERSALLRIAPHLVNPLPIIIPTYGYGKKSKLLMRTGVLIYDLLTCDRNKGLQVDNRIPLGYSVSRQKILQLFPGLIKEGLTGGVVFYDGQIYNPPRLVMSILRTAADHGAVMANYCPVLSFLKEGNTITGVVAQDALAHREVVIHARHVLNAAGPWAAMLLKDQLGIKLSQAPTFSRDLAFVVRRAPKHKFALAFASNVKDSDSLLDRGGRHLFIVPWRDLTLFGVWHKVFKNAPEEIIVTRKELQAFIDELNQGYPGLKLRIEEILTVNTGLTLYGDEADQQNDAMSFGKRSLMVDHAADHGIKGLTTLIGVRATMGRKMAELAIAQIANRLNQGKGGHVSSDETKIFGAAFQSMEQLRREATHIFGDSISGERLNTLIRNYGTEYQRVLEYADGRPYLLEGLPGSTVTAAEVIHAVREEMAQSLSDVVYRRTDLGTGGNAAFEAVERCATLMANELEWSDARRASEISCVRGQLPTYCKQQFLAEY